MKTLLALLLLTPNLSWGSELKDLLKGTNTNLLTFGIFKINYQFDYNYKEILKNTKTYMSIYSTKHFKKNFDLDNNMPAESLEVSSAVEDSFRVWEFPNKFELKALVDNKKDRLLVIYKVKYLLNSSDFDNEIKKNRISKSNFFEDFDSDAFLKSFDSKTICRILRINIQSALGFFPPSEIYDYENDNNDFKINTNYSYTDTRYYESFINRYFTNEGEVLGESAFKDYKPMQVDINVLAENLFYNEKTLCHGNAGDFNPSIVEYDIYSNEIQTDYIDLYDR